jgi:hypothetical protein
MNIIINWADRELQMNLPYPYYIVFNEHKYLFTLNEKDQLLSIFNMPQNDLLLNLQNKKLIGSFDVSFLYKTLFINKQVNIIDNTK